MPVLPAVDSTTSPPGLSSPRFSASKIIHLPARSFTDWPGFMNSALPRMVQPVASEARFNLMSGVLPMDSTTSFLMVMSGNYRLVDDVGVDLKVGSPARQADPANSYCCFAKMTCRTIDISGQAVRKLFRQRASVLA